MITSHIDLGQLILACLIAIVGWFVKREITNFGNRLDKHETHIFNMMATLQQIVGQVGIIVKLGDGSTFTHRRATDRLDS